MQFFLCSLYQLHQFVYVGHAEANTETFDTQSIIPSSPLTTCKVILNLFTNIIYSIIINVDNFVDVISNTNFQVSDNEMKLFDEPFINVFAIISDYLFDDQYDLF